MFGAVAWLIEEPVEIETTPVSLLCLHSPKDAGGKQTYIDIFRQHLICRPVFTENIIVNSCPGSSRPGEETQHPATKRISHCNKNKNQTPDTGLQVISPSAKSPHRFLGWQRRTRSLLKNRGSREAPRWHGLCCGAQQRQHRRASNHSEKKRSVGKIISTGASKRNTEVAYLTDRRLLLVVCFAGER